MNYENRERDWRTVADRAIRGVVLLASSLILLVVCTLLLDGVRNCNGVAKSAREEVSRSPIAEGRVARPEASSIRGNERKKEGE